MPTTEEVVFAELLRGIEGQVTDLSNTRAYAGVAFSAGGVAAALLVTDTTHHSWLFWLAVGAFALVAILTVRVYWPVEFGYDYGADNLVARFVMTRATPKATLRSLCQLAQEDYTFNRPVLDQAFWFQRGALAFFVVEVIALVLNFANN